ncbi:DUF1028 domain-containing protein [candidate division KSB1 bacterium]|nr:DUF1028 domain-containing protein [candidate division KSB1 bacterium]
MSRILYSFLFIFISSCGLWADNPKISGLVHTYSIVARDSLTGEMGVAVQSHWFSVGSLVSWAEAGVGAIATQSFVNPAFGPEGLTLLKNGHSAGEVLKILIGKDDGESVRQLAIVDAQGNVAVHTGDKCIPEAGHQTGKGYSVQANMMLNNSVWPAMADAFESSDGTLAERLLSALEAAQTDGGDIRGCQSASLLVVKAENTGKVWEDRLVDLRIEDHPEPLVELKRLLRVHQAYEYMNAGDLAIEHNDIAGALKAYSTAERMFPENLEMKYWHAVSLVNIGQIEESLPLFQAVFDGDSNWRILTERLPSVGLLQVDPAQLQSILSEQER